jgi:hypothetical protein
LELKALYIGSLEEQAQIQKALGVDIPDHIVDYFKTISKEALDYLDEENYHRIAQMLIKRPRDHLHAHGRYCSNMLEELMFKQQQNEQDLLE